MFTAICVHLIKIKLFIALFLKATPLLGLKTFRTACYGLIFSPVMFYLKIFGWCLSLLLNNDQGLWWTRWLDDRIAVYISHIPCWL